MKTYDYVIIGTGIAGLNAARLIPENKKVLILCKKNPWNCNTYWAQGGIAKAVDETDIEDHVNDTLNAGVNQNDVEAVRLLSEKSIDAVPNLIQAGMQFDKNSKNELAYTKEAAHSRSRILHADGDATGKMIHEFLMSKNKHELKDNVVVCDLLIQDDICYGVEYFVSETKTEIAYAHNTIIASGGIGALYKYHTNSTVIAGELQGIILEKGLPLKDMEMTQFHPTVVRGTSFARKPLISEALRGEGAYVVDDENRRFLFDYHKDGELAPRDVVSRSIYDYNKRTKKPVYLSFEQFEPEHFRKRFPNIYSNLKSLGHELPQENVSISPAFHYSMGGIKTTLDAKVKGMKNLYAIGECACTGVHGANRLASNSLLEGLVFSQVAIDVSNDENLKLDFSEYKKASRHFIRNEKDDEKIKAHLRKIMWESAGILRDKKTLEKSIAQLDVYLNEKVGRLLYLRLLTAKSVLTSALNRDVSVGAHFMIES